MQHWRLLSFLLMGSLLPRKRKESTFSGVIGNVQNQSLLLPCSRSEHCVIGQRLKDDTRLAGALFLTCRAQTATEDVLHRFPYFAPEATIRELWRSRPSKGDEDTNDNI